MIRKTLIIIISIFLSCSMHQEDSSKKEETTNDTIKNDTNEKKAIKIEMFQDSPTRQGSFKEEQLRYKRVRTAYNEKGNYLKSLLLKKGINSFSIEIFIRAFKKEQLLEVWIKDKDSTKYKFLKSYDFCSYSGTLGPKRRQGDGQVPEGFYYINIFNHTSKFYLSLGLNYPNQSDRILGERNNLGGDIFIHGSCVTIGCIPITNNKIKELYVLAVEAKTSGQGRIPVHIFPTKLDSISFNELKNEYSSDPQLINFWQNLKDGYDYFEENKSLPIISVASDGEYLFE